MAIQYTNSGQLILCAFGTLLTDIYLLQEQIEMFLSKSDASNSGDLSLAEFIEYLKQHERNLRLETNYVNPNFMG